MEKRVYSLNLAAYIQMHTGIEPHLGAEYDDTKGTLVYCVFPEIEAVAAAIRTYKQDEVLHEYLQSYALLREQIKQVRE